MVKALWYDTNKTLGTGVRVTNITVTTTPTSLDSLLNTAVAGRASLPGRRVLKFRNMDVTNAFYLLESSTQTTTNGWNVPASADFSVEASESFSENEETVASGGGGLYLACAAGTISVKVLEAK